MRGRLFSDEMEFDDRALLGAAIRGALASTIAAHGPITAKYLSSAEKRIVGALKGYNQEVRRRRAENSARAYSGGNGANYK